MINKDTLVTAVWCGPCKTIKSFLASKPKDIDFVDADENEDFCKQWGIRAVPTLITVKNEKIVGNEKIMEHLLKLPDFKSE
jgi:glutaredoxin